MKVKSLAVVLTLFSSIIVSLLAAENDREVREIDRYLRGSKILTTHREGGPQARRSWHCGSMVHPSS